MQTQQQKRAEFALNEIGKMGKIEKETANFYAGAPTLILTNGLGQTMAFLLGKKDKDKDKGKGKEKILFETIKDWLSKEGNLLYAFKDKGNIEFLQEFNVLPINKYLAAQTEALRLLEWLKRYAKAFGEREEEKGKDNG
jgi:CRISPR-associated protein Cmr5